MISEEEIQQLYNILSTEEKQELLNGGCPERLANMLTDDLIFFIRTNRKRQQDHEKQVSAHL